MEVLYRKVTRINCKAIANKINIFKQMYEESLKDWSRFPFNCCELYLLLIKFCFFPTTMMCIVYPIIVLNIKSKIELHCHKFFGLLEKNKFIGIYNLKQRDRTQHAEFSRANFHPTIFIQLLNSVFMNLQTHHRTIWVFKILLELIHQLIFIEKKVRAQYAFS